MRRLAHVLGATAPAVSAVVSAYLFGLALGAYLFGRYSNRIARPLRFYGIMECAIGLYCVFTPLFFNLLTYFEQTVGARLPEIFRTPERFIMSLVVMALPTTMMGATLPALIAALVPENRPGSGSGRLYAANTLGAAAGAALAGYVLIQTIGERGAIWFAACVNMAIGAFVIYYLAPGIGDAVSAAARKIKGRKTPEASAAPQISQNMIFLCVAAFGVSGLISITYEIYWTRALQFIVGTTTYSFTTMLTAFILGLGLGSLIFARLADRFGSPALIFGLVEMGIAATALIASPLFNAAPLAVLFIYRATGEAFALMNIVLFMLAISLMILPTLLMGGTFPLITRIVAGMEGGLARRVGAAYALNTAGGIMGAIAAAFIMLPAVGTQKGILISAAFNGLLGIILAAATREKRGAQAALGGTALIIALLLPAGVPWNMHRLTSGVYFNLHMIENADKLKEQLASEDILYYREDSSASVLVTSNRVNRCRAIVINGKPEASSGAMDLFIEYMLGHLPVILAKNPSKAAVVGLGTGTTFGSVASHNYLDVTVAEISPAVIPGARFFAIYNHNVLDLPNARVVHEDGRQFLLHQHPGSFDIITSDPIHPFNTGGSSLYTLDYYKLCISRLKPGGIFCQWLPLYHLSQSDIKTIMATFYRACPNMTLWMASNDALLIGSKEPDRIDLDQIEARFAADPAYARDLRTMGITNGAAFAGRLLLGTNQVIEVIDGATITTDDRPILEFSAPRNLYKDTAAQNWRWLKAERREGIETSLTGSDEAIKRFRASRAATALVIEAGFLVHEGNNDGAIRLYQEALRIQPDNLAARSQMSDIILAPVNSLVEGAKEDEARRIVTRALEIYPDNPQALSWMAHNHAQKGDFVGAKQLLLRAHSEKPFDAEILADLGLVEFQLGDEEEALKNIREAIDLEPDRPRPYFILGFVLESTGRKDEAATYYRAALRLDPTMNEARQRLEAIH